VTLFGAEGLDGGEGEGEGKGLGEACMYSWPGTALVLGTAPPEVEARDGAMVGLDDVGDASVRSASLDPPSLASPIQCCELTLRDGW
jgi:hypothetical protein